MRLQRLMCVAAMLCMSGCIFSEEAQPNSNDTNNINDMPGQDMQPTPDMSATPDQSVTPDQSAAECDVADDCGAGEACCGGACVDTRSDAGHCGGCGLACAGSCEESVCLCGPTQDVDTIATWPLGDATRHEVITYVPSERLANDELVDDPAALNFALVTQSASRSIKIELFDGFGVAQERAGISRELSSNPGDKIENFQALALPDGVLLVVNWSRSGVGERISLYTFVKAGGALQYQGGTDGKALEKPSYRYEAIGGLLDPAGLLLMGIVQEGVGGQRRLAGAFFPLNALGGGAAVEPKVIEPVTVGMPVASRSRLSMALEQVGGTRHMVVSWYGRTLLGVTSNGVQSYQLDVSGAQLSAQARAHSEDLATQNRPMGLNDSPAHMLPVSRADDRWSGLYARYGQGESSVEMGDGSDNGSTIRITRAPTTFSATLALGVKQGTELGRLTFGWLQSETRPALLNPTPVVGKIMMSQLVLLDNADIFEQTTTRALTSQERYRQLDGITHSPVMQALVGERSEGDAKLLDLFLLHKNRPVCAAKAAAP